MTGGRNVCQTFYVAAAREFLRLITSRLPMNAVCIGHAAD